MANIHCRITAVQHPYPTTLCKGHLNFWLPGKWGSTSQPRKIGRLLFRSLGVIPSPGVDRVGDILGFDSDVNIMT
jgi:hypothetical protein